MSSAPAQDLPPGLLLAYYGDDFTGSTDVMDALAQAGLPTVLYLDTPPADALARFPEARCVGLAGLARSRSPAWMAEQLPGAFAALARLGAPILQYKVCSTFDSAPQIGSIGCAIDLALATLNTLAVPATSGVTTAQPGLGHDHASGHGRPPRWSPLLVGAPRLGRYLAFGTLFAQAAGQVHRIDRHPTLSRHPVTPMGEADLRHHLAQQTPRRTGLIDLPTLRGADGGDARLQALLDEDQPIVLIDTVDEADSAAAGRLVWQSALAAGGSAPLFCAASSGLEYALVAHWRQTGLLPARPAPAQPAAAAPVIAAVCGSCSPVTAAQIAWAEAQPGFEALRLDLARLFDDDAAGRAQPLAATTGSELARVVDAAVAALAQGRSPIVYSARGPDDPAVTGFDALAARYGLARGTAAERVGAALAAVLNALLDRVPGLRRVAVAGGDSSGAVASALGGEALTVAAPLVPGAPLCRLHARPGHAAREGLEIVLKGGQMGAEDFFGRVRAGG